MMQKPWLLLVPELERFPEEDWACVLGRARHTEFDVVELVGLALGVAAAAAVTQYVLPDTQWATRTGAALFNFITAVPLLALVAAPLHLRRLRRGVRAQLQRQGRP